MRKHAFLSLFPSNQFSKKKLLTQIVEVVVERNSNLKNFWQIDGFYLMNETYYSFRTNLSFGFEILGYRIQTESRYGHFFSHFTNFLRRVQLGSSMIFVTFDRFMKSKILTTTQIGHIPKTHSCKIFLTRNTTQNHKNYFEYVRKS